jgi:hypothetical protein
MHNEKDIINAVVKIYAISTNASTSEKKLAKIILTDFYSVESFFLVHDGDYVSGLNMNSVELFIHNMASVRKAISGEI